jgi:hypothetical protein
MPESDYLSLDSRSVNSSGVVEPSDLAENNGTSLLPVPTTFDYKEIEWERLSGFTIPTKPTKDLTGWFWAYGVPIEEMETGRRSFLCHQCHTAKSKKKHRYVVDSGTRNANIHMRDAHQLTKDGSVRESSGSSMAQSLLLPDNIAEQNIINYLAKSFDHHYFRKLLVRWVVYDNIAFHKIENVRFRELLMYLNSQAESSLPTDKTIRNWVHQEYEAGKPAVIAVLGRAQGQVHISFDLWTSRNMLSLVGIVVHFLDAHGKYYSFLLSLPEQQGSHSGSNIADNVQKIIDEFGLKDKIGYFVLDNATNNDTCMEKLGQIYGFNHQQRRLRCMGHIINLVAR